MTTSWTIKRKEVSSAMPKKMAVVNYQKCRPEACDRGVCAAMAACPRRLIKQEAPNEAPVIGAEMCQNCAKCVLACPSRAIELM